MKLFVIAASALLVLGTARAQSASPLYAELGYTFATLDSSGAYSAHPRTIRGIVGYDVHKYAALEAMLAFSAGTDNKVKLKDAYGVFVKPKYDFGNIEAFARLGVVHTDMQDCNGGSCRNGSGGDVAYGIGANYRVTPKMHIGLDYLRSYDKGGVRIDGVTLGVGYRF